MKVLVTGATGFIGSRVVRQLIAQGKVTKVLGLCRTPESGEGLKAIGVEPVVGDVQNPELLEKVAREVDVVLHLAFIHDFANMEKSIAVDLEVVKAYHRAITGTNKKVIVTSGTLILGPSEPGKTVDDSQSSPPARHRGVIEKYALENGMSVIRLPPFVYGYNGAGFAAHQISLAKKNGYAAFIDDGSAKLTTVHVDDAASAYVAAVEKAVAGHAYHAVSQSVSYKELATAISKLVGVEAKSIPKSEAPKIYGDFFAWVFSTSQEATGSLAQKELGWKPSPDKPSILDDITHGTYKA